MLATSADFADRVCRNAWLSRLAVVTAGLMILTSSFDIFPVLQAGGNYRFCQVIAPILLFCAALRIRSEKSTPVLGGLWLGAWLFVQILFIPVADFWLKSVA